jgi:hypothetical protein
MAELNEEVATGTKRLVEADAEARKEVVGVHRDLQAERARLDSSWNDLEHDRRHLAQQQRAESLLVPTLETVGLLSVVALVLGFCWYALTKAHRTDESDSDVRDLLLEQVAFADSQTQLIADQQPMCLHHSADEQEVE